MAHKVTFSLALASVYQLSNGLTTCPGFPGFCSESFPGQTCNVVCDFGRNNVPLCQDDGTWTDIPRCVEHDPGVEEQIPGVCPSIPGYCAQGFLNIRCTFDCVTGPDIDSICTQDGTWAPYPTCEGDLRETRDGCDGCPGPVGGLRNRTAEAILNRNTISDRRVPKVIGNNQGRKNIPSFAGNINIGRLNPDEKPSTQNAFRQPAPRQPTQRPAPVPRPTQPPRPPPVQRQPVPRPNGQNFQTNFGQSVQQRQPIQQFSQPQQPQQSFQQGLNRFQPGREASQPLSLFDQIKNKINEGNAQQARRPQQQFQPQPQQQFQPQQQPLQSQQQFQPQQQFQAQQPQQNFGVFEAVSLGGNSGGPNPSSNPLPARPATREQDGFFGVFPEVSLQ